MKNKILISVIFAPFLSLITVSRSASADECAVLPLDTPSGSGSITIIGADSKGIYTFLTASHVIAGVGNGDQLEVEIKLNGESTYVNAEIIKDFASEGIDLAVGKIKLTRAFSEICVRPIFALAPDNDPDEGNTFRDLSVSCDNKETLYKYGYDPCSKVQALDEKGNFGVICDWNALAKWYSKIPCDTPPKINVQVPVSFGTWSRRQTREVDGIEQPYRIIGYSMATRAINTRMQRVATVHLQHKMNGNKDGYDYIYSLESSVPGMSGGPLISTRVCPSYSRLYNLKRYHGIIGIHGRSEEYGGSGGRSGMGLSIPLTNKIIADYLRSNSAQLFILKGENYKRGILKFCETDTIKYVL